MQLFSHHSSEKDPIYAELPPPADEAAEPGRCEIAASDGKLDVRAEGSNLKQALERLSAAVGERWSAQYALQSLPISIWAKGVDRTALMDAIASAADAEWRDESNGR